MDEDELRVLGEPQDISDDAWQGALDEAFSRPPDASLADFVSWESDPALDDGLDTGWDDPSFDEGWQDVTEPATPEASDSDWGVGDTDADLEPDAHGVEHDALGMGEPLAAGLGDVDSGYAEHDFGAGDGVGDQAAEDWLSPDDGFDAN